MDPLIIVTHPLFPEKYVETLRKLAKVQIVENLDEIVNVEEINALIGGGIINRSFIEKAKNLKIIAVCGLGYDGIDLNAASERGIFVTNARTAGEEATVADLTMGLLISIGRKITEADIYVKSGKWISGESSIEGTDVNGKTLGIIGLGYIGALVAERARAFNMSILYHDIIRRKDLEETLGVNKVSLETLLKESDYVTIHTPLLKETYHLIGEKQLKLMKPTSYLINTSRGKIVEEQALIRALRNNWIAGAALDVFSTEPLAENNPLLGFSNVVLTPHIGAATRECRRRVFSVVLHDVIKCLKGQLPTKANIVSPI